MASIEPVNVETPVTIKVESIFTFESKSTSELNVDKPTTINLSSTVTVPSNESMIKLPVVVSISLSPVIPICILSIYAPLLISTVFVNVENPVTEK